MFEHPIAEEWEDLFEEEAYVRSFFFEETEI